VSSPHTVYYDHTRDASLQPVFPRGEAGPVVVTAAGEWRTETEVWISPNSHCALVHHGVAGWLTSLPLAQGTAGSGRDVLVPPASAEDVARIFYEADRKTYGATYDFLAFAQQVPQRIHFRVAIDNREYQQTLSQLQFMSTTAARHGHGLRIRI
jgi:hypothetical protein